MARWENVKGNLSFLTTGTDEHGQKVQKEAEKRKMDVKSYCDDVASSFQKELQHYSINIGRFIRTTDPDHVTKVKRVWVPSWQMTTSTKTITVDTTAVRMRPF